jgi:hypothetical protein
VRSVPPTAVTFGSVAGVLAAFIRLLPSQVGRPAPWSPEDANSVVPLPESCENTACCFCRSFDDSQASASPKLWETTSA